MEHKTLEEMGWTLRSIHIVAAVWTVLGAVVAVTFFIRGIGLGLATTGMVAALWLFFWYVAGLSEEGR